ncbi:SPW repeat protein [Sinorhizobium meliloti]|uniref:SPW repeat protein n=1 Tax=Rhizobium meliloti TaxID=382 RepID=UPI0012BB8C5F|nr:SPW repeat protein [Sinorhizobium meliloti]
MMATLMERKKPQDWMNLILAVALFVSPWVMGFAGEFMAAWNAWIVGVVIGALALATLTAFSEWEEWANIVIGIWLVVAPWLLGFAPNANAMWTHVVLGLLVAAISAWALWDERQNPHARA